MALSLLLGATPALAQVEVRLGQVKGPGWSRVRAAVQVALTGRDEVRLVREGESAIIGGEIRSGGPGLVAELSVETATGETRGKATFSGADQRELANDVKERLWARLGPALVGLAGAEPTLDSLPEGDAPEDEPPPPPRAARGAKTSGQATTSGGAAASPVAERSPTGSDRARPAPAPPPAEASLPTSRGRDPHDLEREALRLSLGVGIYGRELGWTDDLFRRLAGYSLGAAPAFRFAAEWYPGAHLLGGPAGWAGLEVEAELPFAVESQRAGVTFPTAASAWYFGAVARLPFDRVEATLGVGLGERRFSTEVSDAGDAIPDLPEVRYTSLGTRLGVTVRLFDRLDLLLRGSWGFMLDAGEVGRGEWFPRSSSHLAGLGAGMKLDLGSGLGVSARFDWQGAFFDLRPEPGDAGVVNEQRVAGGLADNYYLGSLGLTYTVPGI